MLLCLVVMLLCCRFKNKLNCSIKKIEKYRSVPFNQLAKITIINVFILPTLSYEQQFFFFDDHIVNHIYNIIMKYFAKANTRFTIRILQSLKGVCGLSEEINDFRDSNTAALLRTSLYPVPREMLGRAEAEKAQGRDYHPLEYAEQIEWAEAYFLTRTGTTFRQWFEAYTGTRVLGYLEPSYTGKKVTQRIIHAVLRKARVMEPDWDRATERWKGECPHVRFPEHQLQILRKESSLGDRVKFCFVKILLNAVMTKRRARMMPGFINSGGFDWTGACVFCGVAWTDASGGKTGAQMADSIEHWPRCATIIAFFLFLYCILFMLICIMFNFLYSAI